MSRTKKDAKILNIKLGIRDDQDHRRRKDITALF